jgi:hypothetical protein
VIEATPDQTKNGVSAAGFGRDGRPDFWIGSDGRTTPPMHVAFVARSRKEVDAFHEAALAAGASDNGAPGPRPHYGELLLRGLRAGPRAPRRAQHRSRLLRVRLSSGSGRLSIIAPGEGHRRER